MMHGVFLERARGRAWSMSGLPPPHNLGDILVPKFAFAKNSIFCLCGDMWHKKLVFVWIVARVAGIFDPQLVHKICSLCTPLQYCQRVQLMALLVGKVSIRTKVLRGPLFEKIRWK